MDTQIQEARSQGYSDDEIEQFLSQKGIDTSSLNLNTWNRFVGKAQEIAKQEDFPVSVLLGQAALESARGQSNFARQRHNYFGYQAYDSNPDMAKSYESPEDSIRDYIKLIKEQYPDAYAQKDDPLKMLQAIKQGGYATDPDYVLKVASMPEFQQYYLGNQAQKSIPNINLSPKL